MENGWAKKQRFSAVALVRGLTHATRGVWIFLQSTHNSWIQLGVLALAIILGIHFDITSTDWIVIIFDAGLVLTAEALNTAIEIDIDLTSPEYHPFARDTKDVAAGAVLIAAIACIVTGLIIFVPYFFGAI